MVAARKESTRRNYHYKWQRFVAFAEERREPVSPVTLRTVLHFLLHLRQQGLAFPSLKVYLAAIVAYQPPRSPSAALFRDGTVK